MWINTKTFQVYKLHSEIRKDFKNVSMPLVLDDSILLEFNIQRVVTTTAKDESYTKNVKEDDPILLDGVWTQTWSVTDATEDEINERIKINKQNVRIERNNLLRDSDWTQVADAPVDQSEWARYRQALRDITLQEGFPHNIEWPTKNRNEFK